MPVSLCEWRVRTGTFVHWIRDYEIKERKEKLLKERIRRMKILCERLKAKMDDSGKDSEDGENVGKTRHDISNPRKSNQCPHKTTNIKSPGDSSYIKDLLTSCDQCIQDLLTQNYSHIEKILTQTDTSTEHLLGQNDSCLKDLSVPNSSRNHQHASCGASFEELTQSNSRINKLLTQSDSCIKELLYSVDSRKDDTLLSAESCRNYQPIQSDSAVNNFFTRADSDSRILLVPSSTNTELKTQSDTYVQDLLKPRDTSINELLTASDSSVKDLLTPRDSSSNEFPTPKDSSVKDSLTPRDCWINELSTSRDVSIKESPIPRDTSINELLTASDSSVKDLLMPRDSSSNEFPTPKDSSVKESPPPRDYSINELLTASDSSIIELLTQEDSLINELLTPKDSSFYEVLTPRDSPRNELPRPRYPITESLTPKDYSINELLTVSDSSITGLLTKEDSLIKELLTPKDPAVYEVLTPRDLSLDELPVPRSIKESLMPTDPSLTELLKQADVSMNELQNPTDSSVSELLTPRDFLVDASLTPGYSSVRKLLTLREQVLTKSGVKVHEPKRDFRNVELVDNELKEMKSSFACRKEQLIRVGSMSPVEETKNDDSARHRPRFPLSTPTSDCKVAEKGLAKQKEISNESSTSSICRQSLDTSVDGIYNPCVAELLLAKAGDVELNPGPLHGSIDRVLQDSELLLLAKEVPGNCYTQLCIGLGFSYMESQNVLTKHLLDIPGALIEFLCRWKVKQRDGTDCRAVLAGILGNTNMGELSTKLLAGGYLRTETSPSAPDTPQPLIDMTEEQVVQCGHDLQAFYREQMCKIKTDPLDFNSVLEFETIYTNLTLLKSKTPLDYTALLTTKVNGMIPKRLMVEGEGGVGKTTFCSKIAWDWVNGSPQFKQFSWVVVIPLRKIAKGQTIGEIVKNYLSDRNTVTPYQINNYILSEPAKVLIVLDGLDEYDGDLAAEEHSDIAKILRSEKFKECIVLVTTRPWRADQIKSNDDLSRKYAFIGVKGFSPVNVSSYIKKYFVKDKNAGSELIRFIEVNDVIKENMAPFPIYVAMLCILWKNSDSEKRETMRRLKTFSQLFEQMIMFLRDHYVSKLTQILHEAHLGKEMENINSFLLEIGPIAMKGLLSKRLTFNEKDFISCTKAMETCCRIGVLTREKQNISRWERNVRAAQSVSTSVFFPHKLFQEYISALYLANLYDTGRKKYNSFLDRVMSAVNREEFRYLLYFTAAQGKDVGLDIVEKIPQNKVGNYSHPGLHTALTRRAQRTRGQNDFLVDITFEAYNKDTAKSVGQRIFAEEKILTIDEDMPAHTMSGYLFIMEQHGMETLIFRGRSCGPNVSRDLADFLRLSSSLSRLEFHRTTLDEDFYRLLQDRASSAGVTSVKELYVDHQFLGDLHRFDVTVGDLFPGLQQLRLTSSQTVRPGFVERLTHPNLSVLSIESVQYDSNRSLKDGEEWPVPFIGEPASLRQLFSSSFPHLTSLTVRDLVIGNERCEAILHSLRNHKHIKSISFTSCFTDDSLDCLASEMSKENGITVSLQHDSAQQSLDFGANRSRLTTDLMDALCHRTCVRKLVVKGSGMVRSREWFPELQGREVQSKGVKSVTSVKELYVDHTFLGDLERFRVTVGDLFPGLQQLGFTSLQTVTPGVVERLTHPNLSVLSIKADSTRQTSYKDMKEGKEWPVPLIGEPASLGQLFSSSFPQLTSLSFKGLVIGNKRCEAILRSLRNHKHMKSISFISCFTDDELDFLARQISKENQIAITLDHDLKQRKLACVLTADLMDALCHRTCIRKLYINNEKKGFMVRSRECFSEVQGTEVDSKIQTFTVMSLKLHDDQSASCCLERFICLLPCLTDLKIEGCSFHDEFYKDIADRASSSKIQTFTVCSLNLRDNQSAYLGKFICLLPCLTDLKILECFFPDKFYKKLVNRASSSKIQTLVMSLHAWRDQVMSQSASKQLATFLCSLPCLADLTPWGNDLHDDFYTELTSLAASSQNPYFRNNKHMWMLREWSARKERCQQQQLNQRLQAVNPAYQHSPRSWEQLGPNILQPRQSAQPSVQYENDHQKSIQSEHQQVHQFRNAHESGSFQQLGSCSSHPWQLPQPGLHYQNDFQRGRQAEPQQVLSIAPDNQHQSKSLDRLEQQGLYLLQPQRPAQLSTQYRDDQQRNMYLQPTQSHVIINPAQRQSGSVEHIWPPYHLRLAQPPMQYQDIDQRDIQSQLPQSNQFMNPTQQHHLRFLEEQRPPQYPVQLPVRYHDSHQRRSHSLTSKDLSAGMTQLHVYDSDRDRPSTSGLRSADICRAGSTSVVSEGTSVQVSKRNHSDSDSDDGTVSTSESKKRQSGKRRTKTDRDPDST